MYIAGIQKTTLLDYPGLVASTIFTFGCNMRCPFCHNMNIVENIQDSNPPARINDEDVLHFLNKRYGVIEGVCITGGEPTLQTDLKDFIAKIKTIGLKIKLDTNGTNPQILKELVNENLIDYVAMDIKASIDKYGLVCGNPNIDIDPIIESINFLIDSAVDSEFRTTLISEFHTKDDIISIGKLIKGAKRYYLQSFKDSEYVPNHNLSEVSDDVIADYHILLKDYVDNVYLRGREINI